MDFVASQSLLVCIDMQERLLPVIAKNANIIKNTQIALQAASLLKIPMLITEQYPKGLGATHSALFENLPKQTFTTLEKTSFSIFGNETIRDFITKSGAKHIIVCGIETHICVLQSVNDILKAHFKCSVIADAVSSRKIKNYKLALNTMRGLGAQILPLESVLFALMKDCKHEHFKAISAMIK